jgi:predicted RNA binding protein YcfA (HicA-like mRNA interferase family)
MSGISNLKSSQVIRAAESYGYFFDRQKGSHKLYKKDGCARPVPVAVHGNRVSKREIESIINIIGTTKEEFLKRANR